MIEPKQCVEVWQVTFGDAAVVGAIMGATVSVVMPVVWSLIIWVRGDK